MAREKHCLVFEHSQLDYTSTKLEVEADSNGFHFNFDPDDGNKYTLTIHHDEIDQLISFLQEQAKQFIK